MDEAKLKEFIIQVIKDNPKLIFDTVNEYVRDQQKQKEAQQFEESLKNRVNDAAETHTPVKGPEKAPITIIEYSDFQCPYCSQGANLVKEVANRYPEKVKIAFRHNPLNFHQQAMPAAKAAMAANKQGKFWEYHDYVFANFGAELNDAMLKGIARQLDLDAAAFDRCYNSRQYQQRVLDDARYASGLGATGTPTFNVNGQLVGQAELFDTIEQELAKLNP